MGRRRPFPITILPDLATACRRDIACRVPRQRFFGRSSFAAAVGQESRDQFLRFFPLAQMTRSQKDPPSSFVVGRRIGFSFVQLNEGMVFATSVLVHVSNDGGGGGLGRGSVVARDVGMDGRTNQGRRKRRGNGRRRRRRQRQHSRRCRSLGNGTRSALALASTAARGTTALTLTLAWG